MGSFEAPLPGSSAGNTAHPQTRGSANKGEKNEMGTGGEDRGRAIKKDVTFTAFIFMTMYCVCLDIDCHFLLHSLGQ